MFFGLVRYVLPTPVLLSALLILIPLSATCAGGVPVQTRHNETLKAQAKELKENFGEDISKLAVWGGFNEAFLYAIVLVESEGNPKARSRKGARGPGQTMPIAEEEAGCESAHEASGNLACTTNYLAILRDKEGLRTEAKILLGYLLGPTGARDAMKEDPRVTRTHRYVVKVLKIKRVVLSFDEL